MEIITHDFKIEISKNRCANLLELIKAAMEHEAPDPHQTPNPIASKFTSKCLEIRSLHVLVRHALFCNA